MADRRPQLCLRRYTTATTEPKSKANPPRLPPIIAPVLLPPPSFSCAAVKLFVPGANVVGPELGITFVEDEFDGNKGLAVGVDNDEDRDELVDAFVEVVVTRAAVGEKK